MCKEKGPQTSDETQSNVSVAGAGATGGRKLSVTLKRADVDKTFEERVLVNKNSYSTFLKRHAEWKTPGNGGKKIGVFEDVVEEERSVSPVAVKSATQLIGLIKGGQSRGVGKERLADGVSSLSVPEMEESTTTKVTSETTSSGSVKVEVHEDEGMNTGISKMMLGEESEVQQTPQKQALPFRKDRTATYSPPLILPQDLSLTSDSIQQLSSAEPHPSIKPLQPQAMPASQPSTSTSSQPSQNIVNVTPSPAIVRPRSRFRKRDLVIDDSEDEYPVKKAKKFMSSKAAMKSAPSSRMEGKPPPIKVPDMSRSSSGSGKGDFAKKSSIVARKSAGKFRESATPVSERGDARAKDKESSVDTTDKTEKGNLQSPPVSPIQSGKRRLPEPASPLSARPFDHGENQRFSLRQILSSGSHDNVPIHMDANPSGFKFSTLYPDPSAVRVRPPTPPTPLTPRQTRSQDRKNFDILSLVPKDVVPVIDDGKLAFREGCIDLKSGRLKRGVKKFKVGKLFSGEFL